MIQQLKKKKKKKKKKKDNCSMTFYFSFEVFITLNPIQVNMKRGGPTYYYKAKRRDESRTITS